tara:strand:- start:1598 stop:2071 length:474 start_codon:yes stop_codon:yes gene_type:complete
MPVQNLSLVLSDPDQTARRAADLAARLQSGDVVLLSGDVGAGKTHFARALIQSLMAYPEDVPSPTFTLVQTYDTQAGEIWHADLYRLTSIQEIEELGLTDAFDTAICLVEWPDRLGSLIPDDALEIELISGSEPETRLAQVRWTDTKWNDKVEPWTP